MRVHFVVSISHRQTLACLCGNVENMSAAHRTGLSLKELPVPLASPPGQQQLFVLSQHGTT